MISACRTSAAMARPTRRRISTRWPRAGRDSSIASPRRSAPRRGRWACSGVTASARA
jgi:hypothetical protein